MVTNKGTRSITTSTDFSHVMMMIVLALCRRLTIVDDIRKRLMYYLIFVVSGSLLADCAPTFVRVIIPIQTGRGSFLNQWFVKIGWFWTLILLAPFIYMTSVISKSCQPQSSRSQVRDDSPFLPPNNEKEPFVTTVWNVITDRHLMRLWLNTLFWYLSTSTFEWLDKKTSSCSMEGFENEESCVLNGHKWLGFDISGHTFILLFSLLIIMEECSIMKNWENFGLWLRQEQYDRHRADKKDLPQHSAFVKFNLYIRILFLALTALSMIWHFMLFQTVLFYHTIVQKVIAYFWAVAMWVIGYKILYTSNYFSSVSRVPNPKSPQRIN
ncbi:acyl-coenzyme A diphosphatase Fitm isoform X1 [Brevipalpus obovatus]|uniref:acyl-coenzyme A diphosphatase Fitm isoform X1 n=1 Tax=Brevipalpus obovatus TaxID=246614 RepID=UPI003D9EC2C2